MRVTIYLVEQDDGLLGEVFFATIREARAHRMTLGYGDGCVRKLVYDAPNLRSLAVMLLNKEAEAVSDEVVLAPKWTGERASR